MNENTIEYMWRKMHRCNLLKTASRQNTESWTTVCVYVCSLRTVQHNTSLIDKLSKSTKKKKWAKAKKRQMHSIKTYNNDLHTCACHRFVMIVKICCMRTTLPSVFFKTACNAVIDVCLRANRTYSGTRCIWCKMRVFARLHTCKTWSQRKWILFLHKLFMV